MQRALQLLRVWVFLRAKSVPKLVTHYQLNTKSKWFVILNHVALVCVFLQVSNQKSVKLPFGTLKISIQGTKKQ